ncbi:MAG: electron transport complex subunit RsxC [Clostridiales bacterium]|nr:electron transport complex subunit RsxC [Clostridiales bacterium]
MVFKGKSLKGIKVDHNKTTEGSKTERMIPVPAYVYISMSQHIGAPCKPLLGPGEMVRVGQLIADSDAFVSVPIHSSVSGTVEKIDGIRSATGGEDKVMVIKTDRKQDLVEGIKPPRIRSREGFVREVRASGLVGLGGAAFPTHIKFAPKNPDEVKTLIVNGAECEPFITSDYRTMIEDTDDIISGIKITMKYLDMEECFIGIESNKPDAIELIKEKLHEQGLDNIKVVTLKASYPQGAERVLVEVITGKKMAAGVLPAELGVIVSNITTIAFLGQYFRTGMPLISKRITVDGSAVRQPKNIRVPIGAMISDVIEFCGGYRGKPSKIIMGGPMMGRAIFSDNLPIVKHNNAILAFTGRQAYIEEETACINCGRCYRACPINLLPYALCKAYDKKDIERLKELDVMQCMECGSCAYVCPARKPLGFTNKIGKQLVKEASANDR